MEVPLEQPKYRAWIYSVGCATLSLTIWNGAGLPFIYLVLGLFVCIPLYRLSWWHPLHGFPGPRIYRISELPMFYHAVRGTRHRVVKRMHDTYGPIVRTGPNSLSFTSLTAIRQIYGSSHALEKTTAYDMHSIKGEGLFFIKDKLTHGRRRRIWNRSFSEDALVNYRGAMVAEIDNLVHWLLKRSEENGRVDLVKILPQYTYDSTNSVFFSGHAFHSSLLDSDDAQQIVAEATSYFKAFEFLSHAQPLFHLVKRMPGMSRFRKFELLATEAALRRLKNGPNFRDGISYWLDGDGDVGQPGLDETDLPIESETVLIGGSDTVGAISTFMMYFLIANPKWLGLLREEVEGAFHRETLQDHLDTLDRLVVLNAVIQETLRLGMPFSGLPRIVPAEGLSINGHYVPGGTFVSVPIWTHHVDEAYFPNPYNFDPARWISDGKFSSNNGLLLTFGAGPFNCVGSKLAYVQLRILLAIVVLRVDLIPITGFDAARFWDNIRNCRATNFLEPLWVQAVPR